MKKNICFYFKNDCDCLLCFDYMDLDNKQTENDKKRKLNDDIDFLNKKIKKIEL